MKRVNLGFAYIWILVIFSILAMAIGQWSVNYATLLQREKEQELIRIGSLYQKAINEYYNNSPLGYPKYPVKLEELLRDERYSETFRYLRKLEKDPITNKNFEVIRNREKGIIGVYSPSFKRPIKIKNFSKELISFENANSYRDWKFYINH
ncbi:type II secretion system protein [Acinetobacter baumannii]|nr:type II secretion system protein [Acinetobacter baumannii]